MTPHRKETIDITPCASNAALEAREEHV